MIKMEVDKELFDSFKKINCYYENGKVEVIE
nr:MAG TPA: hypothetical protein [Caudoviricetes sp.]